jgi:hypothetical protein
VNFLGKGLFSPKACEYTFRLYNASSYRPKRLSFYVFNESCGLGTGSYFQDDIEENEWIFVVGIVNGTHTQIYKAGIVRDSDYYAGVGAFAIIKPQNTISPLRIATVQKEAYLPGLIDEIRIYNRTLNNSEIQQLSQIPTFCTNISYSNWSPCFEGEKNRTILYSSPEGCVLQDENLTTSCLTNECFDKDATSDIDPIFEPSYVSYNYTEYTDYCLNDKTLVENYCGYKISWDFWNIKLVPKTFIQSCQFECVAGKCLTTQETNYSDFPELPIIPRHFN